MNKGGRFGVCQFTFNSILSKIAQCIVYVLSVNIQCLEVNKDVGFDTSQFSLTHSVFQSPRTGIVSS